MAKKGASKPTSTPPDTYELKHALGQVKKLSVRPNTKTRYNGNTEQSITNTTTSIGEINLTINNTPNTPGITSGQTGSFLTEADIDLKITNIELKYTESQASFQKEIRDEISKQKEAISESIENKVSKEFIYWVIGLALPIILSVLGYYFFEIQDLKKDVSIIEYKLGLEKDKNTKPKEKETLLDSLVTLPKQQADRNRVNKISK